MSIIVKGLRRLFNGRGEGDNEFLLDNPWQHVDFTQAYHAATDDDASSMSSFSTNATIDDNPGTGRLIDKYLYQRGGKKVERLIFRMWIKTSPPNPAQISRYFEVLNEISTHGGQIIPLKLAITNLESSYGEVSAIISGLKCLVQQTK